MTTTLRTEGAVARASASYPGVRATDDGSGAGARIETDVGRGACAFPIPVGIYPAPSPVVAGDAALNAGDAEKVADCERKGGAVVDEVEVVDGTDLLVELFHPDEATRKLLAEVRKHPKGVRVH